MLRHAPKRHAPEAGRLACGGGRMCVSLRETVGDRDDDDEATWTYLRRDSRRDTHIRCAPSRKGDTRFARKARSYGWVTRQMTPPTSSATSNAPAWSTITPTGRPNAWSPTRNPVSTSSASPTGMPLENGTKITL